MGFNSAYEGLIKNYNKQRISKEALAGVELYSVIFLQMLSLTTKLSVRIVGSSIKIQTGGFLNIRGKFNK